MSSSFGWYAIDRQQRDVMLEAVDQFRDKTTIDDLGLGSIRDSFSDALFPGTSTLHTRVRYVLFLPWLMQVAATKQTVDDMQLEMRKLEFQLVGALSRGGETEGIIGIEAGENLTRPPSIVYWSALKAWGIIDKGLSLRTYFERCFLRRELARDTQKQEDPEALREDLDLGVDPRLPDRPENLLSSADFNLSREESEYLAGKISVTQPNSLFAHLIHSQPYSWISSDLAPGSAWDPAIQIELPEELATFVNLAERFSFYSHGASLLYNLLLAEKAEREERETHYREQLEQWSIDCSDVCPLDRHDQQQIWQMVRDQGRNLTGPTKQFFETWFMLAPQSADITLDEELRELVRNREYETKKMRGRLSNSQALDMWSGASGDSRLSFRWNYVERHLQDIYDGMMAT